MHIWADSSAGRAPRLHRGSHRFKSCSAYHNREKKSFPVGRDFLFFAGVVVKSVITPACHAGGRGFESHRPRQNYYKGLRRMRNPFLYGFNKSIPTSIPSRRMPFLTQSIPRNYIIHLCFLSILPEFPEKCNDETG